MDTDFAIKIATVILGAIATMKVVYEWLYGRYGRLREEYKFARDFLKDLKDDSDLHPFLKQKGYQAIAGDTTLSASEIEYLLELHDSGRALKDYVLGRPYLRHFTTAANQKVAFKSRYESGWSRNWRKLMYFVLYMALFMGAFSPIFIPAVKAAFPADKVVYLAFTFLLFAPAAVLALRAGVRIARAEALVKNQQKHAQPIVVSESSSNPTVHRTLRDKAAQRR
jgi:hypothetical protein